MPDEPRSADKTCLAFDVGLKRIGVAVGEPLLGTARPLSVIENRCGTPDWAAIDALLDDWQPGLLVVGLPFTATGDEQEMTRQARGFMKRLAKRSGIETVGCDERYTSIEAGRRIARERADGRRPRRATRGDHDRVAAALILERWFEASDTGGPVEPVVPLPAPDRRHR